MMKSSLLRFFRSTSEFLKDIYLFYRVQDHVEKYLSRRHFYNIILYLLFIYSCSLSYRNLISFNLARDQKKKNEYIKIFISLCYQKSFF
jgi:hypothetical protein